MKTINDSFREKVLERFLRYAKIHTTSDLHIEEIPSTDVQWDLLNLLVKELEELGLSDISLDDHGYLIARLPASPGGENVPVLGLMAHVDTSSDMKGEGVNPQIHENYDGGVINLGAGYSLDPSDFPDLLKHRAGLL